MRKSILLIIPLLFLMAACDNTTGSSVKDVSELSEMERFAKLEAEFACDLFDSESEQDVLEAMKNIGYLLDKYGFTEQDIEKLKVKYNNTEFVQVVVENIEGICPENLENMQ